MSFLLCCKECTLLVINNFFFPLKDLFKCQGPSNKTQQVSKCEKKKKNTAQGPVRKSGLIMNIHEVWRFAGCYLWAFVCSGKKYAARDGWKKRKKKSSKLYSQPQQVQMSVSQAHKGQSSVWFPKLPTLSLPHPRLPDSSFSPSAVLGKKVFFFFFFEWSGAQQKGEQTQTSLHWQGLTSALHMPLPVYYLPNISRIDPSDRSLCQLQSNRDCASTQWKPSSSFPSCSCHLPTETLRQERGSRKEGKRGNKIQCPAPVLSVSQCNHFQETSAALKHSDRAAHILLSRMSVSAFFFSIASLPAALH